MQSTLGAALRISVKRLVGTALGCGLAVLLATHFGANGLLFGAAVLAMGLLCSAVGLDRTAYRFAGITLAIVMLVAGSKPVWILGIHRFIEVSVGIAVALVIAALWPEDELRER